MRAVIADKQDLFRQSLTSILTEVISAPVTVFEAGCLNSFNATLRKEKISLILLGTNICHKGMVEHCDYEHLRTFQPNTPVLVISETPNDGNSIRPERLPIHGLINKSFAISSYKKAISQILRGGTYFPTADTQIPPSPQLLEQEQASDLTPRQRDVLYLLAQGKSNREIAAILNLSEGTVKVHVTAIFRTFKVRNRTQAMLLAQKLAG